MRMPNPIKLCLLVLSVVPFMGSMCVTEKTVELTYRGNSETTFHATGSQNVDLGSSTYDVLADLDLEGALLENDIQVSNVRYISMRALYYTIETPDPVASRMINDATMTIQFTGRSEETLATGFSAPAGAATGWIDITALLQTGGVNEINEFLERALVSFKTGYPVAAAPTEATFDWSGTSTPTDQETDFFWKAKMEVTVVYALTAEFPDF